MQYLLGPPSTSGSNTPSAMNDNALSMITTSSSPITTSEANSGSSSISESDSSSSSEPNPKRLKLNSANNVNNVEKQKTPCKKPKCPSCKIKKPNCTYNKNVIMTMIIWFEYLSIFAILLGYGLYAFGSVNYTGGDYKIGDNLTAVYDYLVANEANGTLGWCLAGAIIGGILYLAAVASGFYARMFSDISDGCTGGLIWVGITSLNIVYHLARWPILVYIILSNTEFSSIISEMPDSITEIAAQYNITYVNEPMVILAFWTDSVVVLSAAVITVVAYLTALGFEGECWE